MNKKWLYEAIDTSPHQGASCTFVQVPNTDEGIKVYTCRRVRDVCYFRQRRLSKYGLSPPVIDRFTVNSPHGKLYCYRTKNAKRLGDEVQRLVKRQKMGYSRAYGKIHTKYRQVMYDTMNKVRKYYPNACDEHIDNFGWYGDRVVLIDHDFCQDT